MRVFAVVYGSKLTGSFAQTASVTVRSMGSAPCSSGPRRAQSGESACRSVLCSRAVWVRSGRVCCIRELCGSGRAGCAVIASCVGPSPGSVLCLRAVWLGHPHWSQSQHATSRFTHTGRKDSTPKAERATLVAITAHFAACHPHSSQSQHASLR